MHHSARIRRWIVALATVLVVCASRPVAAGPPEPAPELAPIALASRPQTDRAIEARLVEIYSELDHLEGIEVEVVVGVVHLGGRVLSLGAVDDARAIAIRTEGVVAVADDVEQDRQVQRRLQPVFEDMRARMLGWLTYLPLFLIATMIVAAAWLLSRLLARRRRKRLETGTFVRELVGHIGRVAIVVIGVAFALELLGATALLGGLLGAAGIMGIAFGLAFKDTGENYIASVLLSIRRPFDPHDYVKIGDDEGVVVRLTSRATLLMTLAGNNLRIPNATVFRATITNYTRNPERRFDFQVGVAFEVELRSAQVLAVATLAAVPGVLAKPAPSCFVQEFGESAMTLWIAGWVDQSSADWFKVRSEAKRMVKSAFDRAGIDIPVPILRVRSTTDETTEVEPKPLAVEPALDVTPDEHLRKRVDEERATVATGDLLGKDGQLE